MYRQFVCEQYKNNPTPTPHLKICLILFWKALCISFVLTFLSKEIRNHHLLQKFSSWKINIVMNFTELWDGTFQILQYCRFHIGIFLCKCFKPKTLDLWLGYSSHPRSFKGNLSIPGVFLATRSVKFLRDELLRISNAFLSDLLSKNSNCNMLQ